MVIVYRIAPPIVELNEVLPLVGEYLYSQPNIIIMIFVV